MVVAITLRNESLFRHPYVRGYAYHRVRDVWLRNSYALGI